MNSVNEVPGIKACGRTLEYPTENYNMRILSRNLSLITNEICRPDGMIGS